MDACSARGPSSDWLVVRQQCFRNLNHQPLVPTSLGSMWSACSCHSPPVGGGGLSFCRTSQRYASDCYLHPFRRNQESCDSIVLIIKWLSLLFGTQGKHETKAFFLQTRNGGHRGTFFTQEGPPGSCLASVLPFLWEVLVLLHHTWLSTCR